MASKYWIKLYHEILNDAKMGMMRDRLWRRTIELFLFAGEEDENGLLPSIKSMAWRLRCSEEQLETEMMELADEGIVNRVDGMWIVTNFAKRQSPSSSAERVRKYRQRRAKASEAVDDPVMRKMILSRDHRTCVYCGKKGAKSLDHIVPVTQGGENDWLNLAAACIPCNSKKKDRTPEEAEMPIINGEVAENYQIYRERLQNRKRKETNTETDIDTDKAVTPTVTERNSGVTHTHEVAGPNAEIYTDMLAAVSGVVKTIRTEHVNGAQFDDVVYTLIGYDITPSQVRGFGDWWKDNGWYSGKPALKTMIDEIQNYLASGGKQPAGAYEEIDYGSL